MLRITVLAIALACLAGPGIAAELPGAPKWKDGAIKRGADGIVLDKDKIDGARMLAPKNTRKKGLGTGFFINEAGDVVTNNHVVGNCKFISVEPVTGGVAEGRIHLADEARDLAVLSTGLTPEAVVNPPAQIRLSAGDTIRVIGYPTRTLAPLDPVLQPVTFIGFDHQRQWVSVSGKIYPGNSGGPAFDRAGQLVGVVVAKIHTPSVYKKTGVLVEDVGFVIPLSETLRFLAEAETDHQRLEAPVEDYISGKALTRTVVKLGCWS